MSSSRAFSMATTDKPSSARVGQLDWLPLLEPVKVLETDLSFCPRKSKFAGLFLDDDALTSGDVTGIPPCLPPPGLQSPASTNMEESMSARTSRGTPSTSASSSPTHSHLAGCSSFSPCLGPSPICVRPPPGLEHIRPPPGNFCGTSAGAGALCAAESPFAMQYDMANLDSFQEADETEGISLLVLPAAASHSAEWSIQNIFGKLKTSCGCPLVSPALQVGPFDDLRVHFVPGDKWQEDRRAAKKGKKQGKDKTTERKPAALRLKLGPEQDNMGPFEVQFSVGGFRLGPFSCNLAERPVMEFSIDADWCKLVEAESESLTLQVEIV